MTDRPGQWIESRLERAVGDRYLIERELGRGGMAVVYLAEDRKHHRRVAVKVLKPELAQALGAERFLREIEMAARLSHPNILPLHDSGDAGDQLLYYVMPYVEGESLRGRLDRERQLPLDDALRIAGEVAEAIAYAHAQGIVHRDIKPENILFQAGHALVSDFGIARAISEAGDSRLTETGLAVGTVAYMSPEQAAGESEVDARSDIYSLGCVLYEMIAGEPPYTGATAQAVLARKAIEPVPRLRVVRDTVSANVEGVVNKALARAPADRFATATQLAAALQRLLAALPAEYQPRETGQRRSTGEVHPKRRRLWGLAAAVSTVALVTAGVLWVRAPDEQSRLEYTPLTSFADAATSPALSPDGRMLAFVRGHSTFYGPGEIYVKLLPDGDPVRLTNDSVNKMDPVFTPDGTRITYTVFGGLSLDTWVVPALGRQAPQPLLTNAEGLTWFSDPANEPRGVFSEMTGRDVQMGIVTSKENRSEHHVVYMPPETGMAHRSSLSPDRKHVLVIEMDYYSWLPCRLVPFDGSSPGRTVGPVPAQCTDADWSPDGKWMYFSANAGNGFHIWRQRFPDGKPELVTPGVTEEEGIEFAPDGQSFVTSIGTRQSTVWVHDEQGDRQITSEGYAMLPSISPDGKKLYYMVRAHAVGSFTSGALWVADLETAERQRLLPGFLVQQYHISSDGKRVLFVAADDSTRSPIWLAALDGRSAPRRIVARDGLQAFFGAEGDVLFAAREGRTNAAYRMKEDGSDLKKLLEVSSIFATSPDGQWVTVWVTPDAVKAYDIREDSIVLICESCSDPGSFEIGPWAPTASWSPDGKFFNVRFARSTYAIPLERGRALPSIPAAGFRTEQEIAALPGALRIADAWVFPGPNPLVYAFTKVTTQRNIFRVPVR